MIRELLRQHIKTYLLGVFLLLICIYVQTLSPIVLGRAIDALGMENIDVTFVGQCALQLIGIAVAAFSLRFAWRYLIIGNSRHIERTLRERLCQKLQMLPVGFYHKHRSGDLMAYVINDISAVRMALGLGLSHLLTGVSTMVFSLFSMTGTVHTGLTLAAFSPVPVAVLCILLIGRIVQDRFRRVQSQFAVLSGHVNENIMGMRVIKSFVQEEAQERAYDGESEEMMRLNIRLTQASAAMNPITQALFGLSFAISIFYGGSLVRSGVVSVGAFATFNAYLLMIMSQVTAMGRVVNILQRGMASSKRLEEIFEEPSIPGEDMAADDTVFPARIEARGLTFRYPGAEVDALDDISFIVTPGKTLGVAGPTGCGKSTLLNLIMKFYQAPGDSLFIGGRDICSASAFAIRNKAGYVPQESFLFSGTLAENIAFYEPGADEERVRRAASMAGMDADLAVLPSGLETPVGERGAHVSGGQRQRISLARALIRNPMLLLLDDTLSAVDNHTQRVMLEAMEEYRKSRAVIIVAHKLSAVMHAEEILYMEQGRIVERGTHEHLLAQGGAYAALWAKQQGEEGMA